MLPGELFNEGERATICERGLRAVAVPRAIGRHELAEVLRMTGLPRTAIDAIRANVEGAPPRVFRPLARGCPETTKPGATRGDVG